MKLEMKLYPTLYPYMKIQIFPKLVTFRKAMQPIILLKE